MCMHISLRPRYLPIYETSVRFFNVCHPIELKCDFSIINEFNSNGIKLQILPEFPTLISWTSPFLNQGLYGGTYIFYLVINRTFYKKPWTP